MNWVRSSDKSGTELSSDILRGGWEITEFMFRNRADYEKNKGKYRKKLYFLVSQRRIPVFRMAGAGLWARRSTLLAYIESQEQQSLVG
jgi:hypothetical protein